MLPFSVDKLIMEFKYKLPKQNEIVKSKYDFCVAFEKELRLNPGEYSTSIYDYIFNLFNFKQAFGELEFKRLISEFKDMDFINSGSTCNYISRKYTEFIHVYKKYFMDYFGFNHEDSLYITRKIYDNKSKMREKIRDYI